MQTNAVAYIKDQSVGGSDSFQTKVQWTNALCGPKGDSTRPNNRHRDNNRPIVVPTYCVEANTNNCHLLTLLG